MAGPHVPGPLGVRSGPHFGLPNTFTLGTGLAMPGPLNGASLGKKVAADDDLSDIENDLQRAAQELVNDFAQRMGPGAFINLSRADIASGLRARVDNPTIIQQGPTQFCGPGSFIVSIATDDPV